MTQKIRIPDKPEDPGRNAWIPPWHPRLDEAMARPRRVARLVRGPLFRRKVRAVGLFGRIKAARSVR